MNMTIQLGIYRFVAFCILAIASGKTCHNNVVVTKGCTGRTNCTSGTKLLLRSDQVVQIFADVSPFLSAENSRRCDACAEHRNLSEIPRDCQEVYDRGDRKTGIYTVYPMAKTSFQVVCDMDTDGGGWTVLQRRVSNTDFYKTWSEYQNGFGDPHNFWLGNEKIWALTSTGNYALRIDLTASDGQTAYAKYSSFKIENAQSRYRLHISGNNGTAGDSLGVPIHNGQVFATRDLDSTSLGCATKFHGAWWYGNCYYSNLNGLYGSNNLSGMNWFTWKALNIGMTRTEMKIKR